MRSCSGKNPAFGRFGTKLFNNNVTDFKKYPPPIPHIINDYVQRINSDLVGKYLNIASRSASFLKKLHEVIGSIKEVILYNKKSLSLEEVHFHSRKFADANIYRDTALAFTGPIIEFIGILIFFSFF